MRALFYPHGNSCRLLRRDGLIQFGYKLLEARLQLIQQCLQPLVFRVQMFVLGNGKMVNLTAAVLVYQRCFVIMYLNGMLEIMDIDELDMKLVFIMLNILQLFITGSFKCNLPELVFKVGNLIAVFPHLSAPCVALSVQL